MICGTLARIGNEVYELQRPEIGELREPTTAAPSAASPCRTSATPRAASTSTRWRDWSGPTPACSLEGMVAGHERDGRGWKAEWVALPEVCLLTGAALQLARHLLSGLVVDAAAMRSNLDGHGDQLAVRAGSRRADRHGWASTPPSS